jgi:predicted RNA-binding Zn-ribbon protein involved in translation (DUF1610 family)
MTQVPWWQPLQELQNSLGLPKQVPGPGEEAGKVPNMLGKSNKQSPFPLIGHYFRASGVRLWEIAPRKKPRCLESWENSKPGVTCEKSKKPSPSAELTRLLELALAQRRPLWVESPSERSTSQTMDDSQTLSAIDKSILANRTINRPGFFDRPPLEGKASSQPSANTVRYSLFIALQNITVRAFVIEVLLNPSLQFVTPEDREIYLRAAHSLAQQGLSADPADLALASDDDTESKSSIAITRASLPVDLRSIKRTLDTQRTRTIQLLERDLSKYEGQRFESLQTNQAFTTELHKLLESAGLRVVCPHCGQPSILRCLAVGNTATGAFVFDHYLDTVRTFHGGRATIPRLFLIAKPPRRPMTKND